ncbi:SRPBCC family protein [Nocardioides caeni]|uniref:SRPBCC family protein n=1 Tax=Nocardioides caeni TaxID=574700 RepID=A0A4S8NE79_9ACTN|nr:SRPBCC family protein [Nocardioides caeni]THV14605.1 hypothetical protein E9934_08020 [Nocardioides caeni]
MLRRLLSLLILLGMLLPAAPAGATTSAPDADSVELIRIERSVVINVPAREAFAYAADFLNDPQWRAEVTTMTVDGPRRIGAVYTEDSRLGLRPHWVTLTRLTVWEPDRHVVAETLPTSPYYLRSERTFEELAPGRTRMTYLLEYDAAMADAVFGFPVPPILVELGYATIMQAYLGKLRLLLESGSV